MARQGRTLQSQVKSVLSLGRGRLGNIGQVLFANVFNNLSSFVVTVYAARCFGPEKFGKLGLVLSILMFGSMLLDCGLSVSLVRNYNSTDDAKQRADLASSVIKTKLLTVLTIGLLAYPGASLLFRVFPVLQGSQHLLAVGIFSAALLSLWGSVRALEQARRDFTSFARYNYFYALLRAIFYAVALLSHANSPMAVELCLYTLPLTILLAYTLIVRERRVWWPLWAGASTQAAAIMKTLAYGWWVGAASLCFSLLTRLPQFELARHSSARMLGLYGAALSFLAAFSLINDAISSVIVPEVASLTTPDARKRFRRALAQNLPKLAALLLLALGACVMAQLFLLGKAYHDSISIFLVLGSGTIVCLCISVNNNLVHAYGRPELLLYMNLARLCILAVVLSVLSNPDAMSVAIAFTVTMFAGDFLLLIYLRRFHHMDELHQQAINVSDGLSGVTEQGQL
jgi:O-antigen/teichoic acid export membrane protein